MHHYEAIQKSRGQHNVRDDSFGIEKFSMCKMQQVIYMTKPKTKWHINCKDNNSLEWPRKALQIKERLLVDVSSNEEVIQRKP